MKETATWKPGSQKKILAWGKSKVGKTFGAGTFPRPCVLDFDRGMSTLLGPDFVKKHGVRKFIWEEFYERTFKGAIVTAHNAYDDACKFFDEMMKPGKRDMFDTWIIDSGTTLSSDAQNKAVILLGTDEYHHMSNTQKEAEKYGLLVPKIQDYGAERSLVEQFVDMVLSSGKDVVFICHEKEVRDKQGNLISLVPNLVGQSAEAVPLRFDEVYNIEAKKGELKYYKETNSTVQFWDRVCQTQPDGLRKVGSRNGVPNGTPWEYEAVSKAIAAGHAETMKQIAAAQASGDKASLPSTAPTPAAVKTA